MDFIERKTEWIRSIRPGETKTGYVREHEELDTLSTLLNFTTTDEIPQTRELAFVVTDVHDKSYLIGVMEAPFPIVNITTKVDDETNISEVKVTFQRQKSLIPCSV